MKQICAVRQQIHNEKVQKRQERLRMANSLLLRGFTVWEICDIMGLKESTVRSLLDTMVRKSPKEAWEA